MKFMSFIAGLCCVLLIGYLFMDQQTKSRIDQVGHTLIEKGQDLSDKLKNEAPGAGKALTEKSSETPDDLGMKADVNSTDIPDIEMKPAREQKESAFRKKAPEVIAAEIGSDEDVTLTPQAKDSSSADMLEEAQSILMDVGKNSKQ